MERPTPHPSDRALQSFGLGKLDEAAAQAVLNHLSGCADCREKVTALSGDSFLDRLRKARGDSGTPPPARPLSPPATGRAPDPPAEPVPGVPEELAANANYQVVRELGRGGMGVVYLARDVLMDRKVVLKVVAAAHLDRPETRERFVGEIRAAARLDHPNVVKAHAVVQAGALLAFVMEYVDGEDLYRLVKARGPLPIANACYYAYQAALGLQHAHEKGMVHRDIKPHNLMLARGKKHQVKILDFGLAKATSEKGADRGLTGTGQMLGTPDYVAPEQTLDAASATIRADVYSLGCTLYYLLAGRPPFRGRSAFEVMQAHHTDQAQPLEEVRPDAPAGLGAVVRKMMAKDPAERYQTPGEVARELLSFARAGASTTRGSTEPPAARGTMAPAESSRVGAGGPDATALAPGLQADRDELPFERLAEAPAVVPGKAIDAPEATNAATGAPWRHPAVLAGAGAVLLFLTLAGLWAAGSFRTKAADGSVRVVENDEPNADFRTPNDGRKSAAADKVEAAGSQKALGAIASAVSAGLRRSFKNYVGDWMIEGDELAQHELTPQCLVVFGDFAWTDYDFTVKAKSVVGWDSLGVIFRATGAGFSTFTPGANKNTAAVVESWRPDLVELKREAGGRVVHDRWQTIRVSLRGSQCLCYVDDRPVLVCEDTAEPRGAVGLRTWNTVVRFKDIRVTDPSGKVLFEGLPELPASNGQWPPATGPASADELFCLTGHGAPVTAVSFAPNGREVLSASGGEYRRADNQIVGGNGSTVRLWDADTGKELDRSRLQKPVSANWGYFRLGVAPGSPYFLSLAGIAVAQRHPRVGLWEVAGGQLELRKVFPENVENFSELAFSPDGRHALALGFSGSLWEWDVGEKKLLRHLPGTLKAVTGKAIAPDGRLGILARANQPFTEIDLATGKETGRWKDSGGEVTCLAFSRDGRQLLSGGKDGTLRLWDVATAKQVHRFTGYPKPVRSVAFSPDGLRALSGGQDQSVRLWDLRGQVEQACFTGHTAPVNSVAFSPDGRRAVSGSGDYTVRLWRLPPPAFDARGFEPLFNGKDISNWQKIPPHEPVRWVVVDQKLVGVGAFPAGILRTKRVDFSDLALRMDVEATNNATDGVILRCCDRNGHTVGYGVSVGAATVGTVNHFELGKEWRELQASGHRTEPGMHFLLEVRVLGARMRVSVDGKEVVNDPGLAAELAAGGIALRCSKDSVLNIRKLEVKELPLR